MKNAPADRKTIEENILFIRKIMNDTKRAELKSGPIIIFWGTLIALAQGATFFLLTGDYSDYIWPMWGIIALIGATGTFFLARKIELQNTFSERVLSTTWLAFGISAAVLLFLSPFGKSGVLDHGTGINPIMCLLLGMAYRIMGIVYDRRWISYIAYCWWAAASILFAFPGDHSFLVFAVCMILFQVLPGLKILGEYRKELASEKGVSNE